MVVVCLNRRYVCPRRLVIKRVVVSALALVLIYASNQVYLVHNAVVVMPAGRKMSRFWNCATTKPCPGRSVLDIDRNAALLAGRVNISKVYLTIGVPSVSRPQNTSYLSLTLSSLINNLDEAQQRDVLIIVFLADFKTELKQSILAKIQAEFGEYIASGLIIVIGAPLAYYPSFDNLKRTFGDSEERVKWRSKQNYDYAFLWSFSAGMSRYYMQLEDDVVTVPGYLRHIKSFIDLQRDQWTCLEFSNLGYIGKLYKSEDLRRLAQLVALFFQEMPGDFLLGHFNNLMLQRKKKIRVPTLFQHLGYHSSLKNKVSLFKDKLFEGDSKFISIKGDNPPAEVFSDMTAYDSTPYAAYANESGIFWAQTPLKRGQFIEVVFRTPCNISGIIVVEGSLKNPQDHIRSADVEVGWTRNATSSIRACVTYEIIGSIRSPFVKITESRHSVRCVRITLTEDHQNWIMFQSISVFLAQINATRSFSPVEK